MLLSYMYTGIKKNMAVILITSLISNVVGQMGTDSVGTAQVENEINFEKKETENSGYYGGTGSYNRPSQSRGITAPQGGPTSPYSDLIPERKLLPAPPIDNVKKADSLSEVSDTSQNRTYKMGKTEKRILLISGAVLVTGGLAFVLAKMLAKEDQAVVDEGIPEPPLLPQF